MTNAKKDNLTKRVAREFLRIAHALLDGTPPTTIRATAACDEGRLREFFAPNTLVQAVIGIGVFDARKPHIHTHMFWHTEHPEWGRTFFYGVRDDENASGGILDRMDIYYQNSAHAGHIGIDYTTGTTPQTTNQIRRTIDYTGTDYLWNAIKNRCLVDMTNPHNIFLTKEGGLRHPLSVFCYDQNMHQTNSGHGWFLSIPAIHNALEDTNPKILASTAIKIDHAPALKNALKGGGLDRLVYLKETMRHHATRCMITILDTNNGLQLSAPEQDDIVKKACTLNHQDMVYILARDGRFESDAAHPAWRVGQKDRHLGHVQKIDDIPFFLRKGTLCSLAQWRHNQDNRHQAKQPGL